MTYLVTLNLVLDILVKAAFLMVFVGTLFVLKRLDEFLLKAQESAESWEHTAESVERMLDVVNYLPFIGPKRRDMKDLEEGDESGE